ncbi:hypothetical protein [Acetobacter indonesiensis]|uniref:hypothetical protein n=1 Tax=Acetobacter indonesiensis TaxID=104101 RepID=UPI0039EB228C
MKISSALAVIQLLSSHPDKGCVIDVDRLSSGINSTKEIIQRTDPQKTEVSEHEFNDAVISIKNKISGLIRNIRPTVIEYKKRINEIEMSLASKDEGIEMAVQVDILRCFLDDQIEEIERNRVELGPYLTEIPSGFSIIAMRFDEIGRMLPKYKDGKKSKYRKSILSTANSLSSAAKTMREASAVQFKYLLLLKMVRGGLDVEATPSPITSSDQMEELLNEVWA